MIIKVLEIEENDDGGATVVLEFDFDEEAVHFLIESGFNSILAKAIEQCGREKEDGREG